MTQSNTRSPAAVPGALLSEARQIILDARTRAVRSVDAERVRMYWRLGQRIVEEEQGGEARAEYGTALLDHLARDLQAEFGSGFAARQLRRARQFYVSYPIRSALRTELNWHQYRTLIGIDDADKREYYERDLEGALLTHLQTFLLELGNGFSFVARQRRIVLEDDEFFVDLVLYNRLLRCFVLVELKTHKATHADLGQLQMYVNYFDREEKLGDENPRVGILLCADKNDTVVRYSLPAGNATILASRYQLYLPSEADLADELRREVGDVLGEHGR